MLLRLIRSRKSGQGLETVRSLRAKEQFRVTVQFQSTSHGIAALESTCGTVILVLVGQTTASMLQAGK